MIAMNAAIINLVAWQNPVNTALFLALYVILCLEPWLLPILPQIIVLCLLAKFYHARADALMNKRPVPPAHKYGTPPTIPMSSSDTLRALQHIQNTMVLLHL